MNDMIYDPRHATPPTCNRDGAAPSTKEMMAEILAMAASEPSPRRKMALETAYFALYHKVQSRERRRHRKSA